MEEAKASWNTVYQSINGFECQITLRDEDEEDLAERASKLVESITKSGGLPVKRKGFEANNVASPTSEADEKAAPDNGEKTYIDGNGVRRCNQVLKSGTTCSAPVVEKEGKYGPFWSCHKFREHAS